MCVQEKTELSSMSQRPSKVELNQQFKRSPFAIGYKDKATLENFKYPQGWQKADFLWPRGGMCHPLPPGDYGPAPHDCDHQGSCRSLISLKSAGM